jgi:hypothetical protein
VIAQHPEALQLRYLQTLVEVASENNSTTIFPVPIDLLTPFMEAAKRRGAAITAAMETAGATGATEPGDEKTLPEATGTALPAGATNREQERA